MQLSQFARRADQQIDVLGRSPDPEMLQRDPPHDRVRDLQAIQLARDPPQRLPHYAPALGLLIRFHQLFPQPAHVGTALPPPYSTSASPRATKMRFVPNLTANMLLATVLISFTAST